MGKIIERVVVALLEQRDQLIRQLSDLNYNEPNYMAKESTIQSQIGQIDMQIDLHLSKINDNE